MTALCVLYIECTHISKVYFTLEIKTRYIFRYTVSQHYSVKMRDIISSLTLFLLLGLIHQNCRCDISNLKHTIFQHKNDI